MGGEREGREERRREASRAFSEELREKVNRRYTLEDLMGRGRPEAGERREKPGEGDES